jgi:beta-glucosidase
MNMPGGYSWGEYFGRDKSYWSMLEKYDDQGILEKNRITESATRIIATMYQLNQMENFPDIHMFTDTKTDERKKLQRDAATESQILLKNEDDILPLKDIKTIAVIGNAAFERDCINENDFGCVNETNLVVNGHIPLGYGSGTTDFSYLITPLQGIEEIAKKKGIEVLSSGKLIYKDEIRKIRNEDKTVHVSAKEDIESGVEIAKKADAAIVFVKADSGEEYLVVESSIGDRIHLDAWHEGNELIESIAKVNKNIIVVINAPAVINVPWLDKVKAVVFSGFSGAESGHAIADILFGEVYPSGHLPYAWGGIDDYGTKITHLVNYSICETGQTYANEYRYEGIDSAGRKDDRPGHEKEQYDYTEGLYVGQRWFNKQKKKPIFPFGFGLTFTKFEYSELKVSLNKDGLTAEFKVKNVGKVTGQAVPMMFLTFPDSVKDYPEHIFKGFDKVELKSGEEKTIKIVADDHALSYFNVEQNKYVRVKDGIIKVFIAENGDPDQVKLKSEIDSKF